MGCKQYKFSGHAIRRIFERELNKEWVLFVVQSGEIIEDYPDDVPFPSYLILGFIENTPLHVVLALDEESKICYIITVYIPNQNIWQNDYKTRRRG